jgi:hypothetical protein
MTGADPIGDQPKTAFGKVLDSHGYGFQYAVLRTADQLCQSNQSHWTFEASEVPVEAQGFSTRIDFVLQRHNPFGDRGNPFYMVAECKRANPATSNWCFTRASYVTRKWSSDQIILEHVLLQDGGFSDISGKLLPGSKDIFHISIEVRSQKGGDPVGSGRGAIEEAVSQVCRGLNGLIRILPGFVPEHAGQLNVDFIPVVFTTARLFVTDANLGESDLHTGKVDMDRYSFESRPWLILQYNMSPGLKHGLRVLPAMHSISDLMYHEYVRSVAIVSPEGVDEFFKWASNLDRYY